MQPFGDIAMSTRRTCLKRNHLSAALITALFFTSAGAAFAQDSANEDEEEQQTSTATSKTTSLDQVSVVGSRIKRAEIETASPVQIITREELDREGHQSVSDMLQTLTQGTTGDFTGDYYTNSFTPNAQTINLRAIGPGYTLVLINGRRLAQYPMPYNNSNNITNIRTIPTGIVERSEVLTGGASAIYGSDAVAGVVNLVTRKNFDGNQFRVTTGTTAEGGGDSVNFELTGGRTGDRWSAVWALQHAYNEPIFASQRDLTSDIRNNPYGLAVSPQLSHIAIDALGLTVPVGHNALFDPAVCDALGYEVATTATRGSFCGSYDQVAQRSLFNKQKFYSAYGYGTFDITDNTQLFGSVSYYSNSAVSTNGIANWYTGADRFLTTPTGQLTGAFYEPNIGAVLQLQRFFRASELGGLEAASSSFDEKTWTVEIGAQGSWSKFDWEASANYSRYDFVMEMPRLMEKGVHDYFLGPLLGHISSYPIYELDINRWNTPLTPETASSAWTRVKFGDGYTTSQSLNFSIVGDLFDLPAGPVGFAGVIEGNRQTIDRGYDWRLDEPLGENTIYGLGSPGLSVGSRDRYAIGTEFRIPLFSTLTATLAGRYDKYDDITNIDDAKTWNFGLEYRPFSNLLLRGSYATSFRAPDFQMIMSEGAAGFQTLVDEYACRSGQGLGQTGGPRTYQECAAISGDPTIYSIRQLRDGNPELKEEEGSSWGLGMVWDIVENLSLSVDYYDIKLEDRAIVLAANLLLQQEADCRLGVQRDGSPADYSLDSAFCQAVLSAISRNDATPGSTLDQRINEVNSTYINAAYVRNTGADATLNYRLDTDRWGTFRTNLGWSIVLKDEYQRFTSDPMIDYRDLANYYSRSRMRGSFGWSKGDWSANTFFTRYGTVYNWAETERLKPWFLWNLNVSRKFGPDTTATFAVNNVFDNQYRHDPTYTGYPYYMGGFGSDLQGRRFYISLQHRF